MRVRYEISIVLVLTFSNIEKRIQKYKLLSGNVSKGFQFSKVSVGQFVESLVVFCNATAELFSIF